MRSESEKKAAHSAALKKYYEKNRIALLQKAKERREENIEVYRAKSNRYRAENLDACRERDKKRRLSDPEFIQRERDRVANRTPEQRRKYARAYLSKPGSKDIGAAWRAANKPALRAIKAKRRATRVKATPAWFGELDALVMREAADLAGRRAVATGIEWHADHMIPLKAKTASGLHCGANIQVIPASLNIAKGNRLYLTAPLEWISAI